MSTLSTRFRLASVSPDQNGRAPGNGAARGVARDSLERLRRHAAKRVPSELESLEDYARDLLRSGGLRLDAPLVPEDMSFGYHTDLWPELDAAERLALNHWAYCLQYKRIADGEAFVQVVNQVVAGALRGSAPDVAALLERETAEELDHVPAFTRVRSAVEAHHGFRRPRAKPARRVLGGPPVVRTLLRLFGADFVVTYFTGRGIANHVGKGFEDPVGRQALAGGPNAAAQRLTLLHHRDESHHMAVSRLMAACARELLPAGKASGRLYAAGRRAMQRALVRYTFSGRTTEAQERRCSLRALRSCRALRGRSPAFVRALVAAHGAAPSGVDRAINRFMRRPNAKLLAVADLAPEDRDLWADELGAPGHRRYLSETAERPEAA